MPMLSESAVLSSDENFLAACGPCWSAPRRNVRRCLFGKADDETRRRTDQWLRERMHELHVENSWKSAQWNFDFNADAPLLPPPSKDGVAVAFEWAACPADAVPAFYSSRAATTQKIRNVVALEKTPRKNAAPEGKPPQKPLANKPHNNAARHAAAASNDGFAAAMIVDGDDSSTTEASIVVLAASVADTTPQKPAGSAEVHVVDGDDDGEAASTAGCSTLTADPTTRTTERSLRRKQANVDEQTKMTSFYRHRKRSRRSTNGMAATKNVKTGHVITRNAGRIDLSVDHITNDNGLLVNPLSPRSRPTCAAPVLL